MPYLIALTLAVFCLAPIAVASQASLPLPTPTGKIIDEQGGGVHNVLVQVKTGASLLALARALTDTQGNIGQFNLSNVATNANGDVGYFLIVRKAGYLPDTLVFNDASLQDVGVIVLKRDPLEKRIDSVIALMSTAEKIAQMTQPELSNNTFGGGVTSPANGTNYLYGSVLNGGDGYYSTFLNSVTTTLNTWTKAKIPTSYGKDAVHGNAGVSGYTVFPHNIGLGATRDSGLVRRIGEATAKELWAANIDLNFSPAISVAQDPRWGRTYESYGEKAELAVQMGAAMVRGLQGDRYNAPWRVTATAKHYLGDGGTANGKDRGNNGASDSTLRAVHLPGYEAVVEQGVLSIMASFNQIRGTHQHIDSLRLTGWLKTELGFDGYVISDWQGIANSTSPGFTEVEYGASGGPQLTQDAVRNAINAGVDLAMEPGSHTQFINFLTALVSSNAVSMDRINDAVRRILRAKFRAGRMDNFGGPANYVGNTANKASAEHRAIAREAVRKSQVLLKNESSALPLSKNANIHLFGSHHDNIGYQCGGWTITWQGVSRDTAGLSTVGASIYKGIQQVAPGATIAANQSPNASTNADVIVYITGEPSYAEWKGDLTSLAFNPSSTDLTALANYRGQGKKIVTIFVTGRPRIVTELIAASDAFLVAWLPGTEGSGVADILFGDHPIIGKLPITWPGASGAQFQYGFGLNYLSTPAAPEAPTLVSKTHNSVTLAPNVAYEFSKDGVAWQTSGDFIDLAANTSYTFYQRVAATAASNASASSVGISVTTDVSMSVAMHNRDVPVAGGSASSNSNRDGVMLPAITINDFAVGPNPVARTSGGIVFFRRGKEIKSGKIYIYNASGKLVKKVGIGEKSIDGSVVRAVGKWDFTDAKGRLVYEGGYVAKVKFTNTDGKREKYSHVLSVR